MLLKEGLWEGLGGQKEVVVMKSNENTCQNNEWP